jgi:hypothetical protein
VNKEAVLHPKVFRNRGGIETPPVLTRFYSTLNLHAVHLWLPIKNFISGNPGIVAIVGLVATISSIVLAVFFYKLSRPSRLLVYATRTFRVVPQERIKLQGLQITYYGYPVESLSVTRLAVWNAGDESIRRSDFPASDRPVIYGGGGLKIFETAVIETSAAANNVGLTLVDHPVVGSAIGFDFLDPGDGAVFSVVHNGNNLTDIRLNGEIIGGRIWRTVAHGERPTEGGSQRWFSGSAWQRPQESGRSQLRVGAYAALMMLLLSGFVLVLASQWGVGLLLIVIGLMVPSGVLLVSRRVYPPLRLKSFDENLGG